MAGSAPRLAAMPDSIPKLLDTADAGLSSAKAAVDRTQHYVRPGLADAVIEMCRSDIESAERRIQWLSDRLANEAQGAA